MNTELLPYRLKSAKRKKRLRKFDFDKKLLKLERRLKDLTNSKETIFEKLDNPYQKGWKRLFVLKREVAQSENAEFYQGILDKINRVQYHYDESFKWKKRGKRYHRYNHPELPQLRRIDSYYWRTNRPKLSDEEMACFNAVKYWSSAGYRWDYKYEFAQPWLFEIKVLPHIIYEVKLGVALLTQEENFLDDYLYGAQPTACRLAKIRGRRRKYWGADYNEKTKYSNPLKNKQVWDFLEEYE
jgi:hypothetical protein